MEKQDLSADISHAHRPWAYLVLGIVAVVLVGGVGILAITNRGQRAVDQLSVATTSSLITRPDAVHGSQRGSGQGTGSGAKSGSGQGGHQTSTASIQWMQTQNGWQASNTPPACPEPLLTTPVDLSKVTSILYPGQTRGGEYKPHGGFRFDTIKDNQTDIHIPADAEVVDGARYTVAGEVQYTFDFIMPCGMMYRFGHLQTLAPKFQAIVDKFPAPQEMDSRTTMVQPSVAVTKGELVATATGVKAGENTFMDFGVYNLLHDNEASKNATWAAAHPNPVEHEAVCWFDLLPTTDASTIKNLPPGDPTSGKTSDFCK